MAEIDRWLAGINYEPGAARCGRGHSWAKAIADEMDSHVQTGHAPGRASSRIPNPSLAGVVRCGIEPRLATCLVTRTLY